MVEEKFKRHIAYKFRLGDLPLGKPIFENERFLFLELGGLNVARVNVIGNIVDRYDSNGEKNYLFLTLDDGSGQMSLKIFGDDVARFKDLVQGQTVLVIGTLRSFNNELYINPEIIRTLDPKFLLIRKLELEKKRNIETPVASTPQEKISNKDKILDLIRNAEDQGGIDQEQIVTRVRELSPENIDSEIKKLLEEGIVFEPRPGRIRYLG